MTSFLKCLYTISPHLKMAFIVLPQMITKHNETRDLGLA